MLKVYSYIQDLPDIHKDNNISKLVYEKLQHKYNKWNKYKTYTNKHFINLL